jgi:hypothetical protein
MIPAALRCSDSVSLTRWSMTTERDRRRAVKPLDAEMLLYLPARLVERADGGCRQCKLIAQEHQSLSAFGIVQANATQMIGVKLLAVVAVKNEIVWSQMIPSARSVGAE